MIKTYKIKGKTSERIRKICDFLWIRDEFKLRRIEYFFRIK